MRVTEITVKGLFGLFDHVIPLNLEDRITIIHGPNGVGKTVLLKMVDALLSERESELHSFEFRQFYLKFSDESSLTARYEEQATPRRLHIILKQPKKELQSHLVPHKKSIRDSSTGMARLRNEILNSTEWLQKLRGAFSVKLIETQRLTLGSPVKSTYEKVAFLNRTEVAIPHLAVISCAQKLSEKIQVTLAQSAEKSQSLDRTFPTRLLQHNGVPILSGSNIKDELKRLELERARLVNIGLLDVAGLEVPSELPIDAQNERVLSIYVHDAKEKLGVFEDLAERLDLLQRIINKRFLFKKLRINKEQGFVFTSDNQTTIPLEGLSSGEQHELVLLYELLFNTKPNSLILIDEPELSLHVAWQVNFLRDLQEICQLASLDVIIATHSPEIVSDRWDLTVELKGPTK